MKRILFLALFLPFSIQGQTINTFAGSVCGFSGDGGAATSAQLNIPLALAFDSKDNLFIADGSNNCVRKVDALGIITRLAGTGIAGFSGDSGPALSATLKPVSGLAVDTADNIYIGDTYNHRVRKVNKSTGIITTIAGNGTAGYMGDGGPATGAQLNSPAGLAIDKYGNLFISDVLNNVIRKVTPGGIISTIAGNGILGYSGDGGPASSASFYRQTDVEVDDIGNIYIADYNNHRIRKIDTSGIIRTIAGNGVPGLAGDGMAATASQLNFPYSIAIDVRGNLYIADRNTNRIRRIDPAGIMSTYAGTGTGLASGDGGPATAARLYNPWGVAVNRAGDVYLSASSCSVRYMDDTMHYKPFFTSRQPRSLIACKDVTTGIDSVLKVTDFSATNTDTWAIAGAPLHGSVSGVYSTIATTGYLLPVGFTYTPSAGYIGNDTFKISVTGGYAADTATIFVSVISCTLGVTEMIHSNTNNFYVFPNPANTDLNIAGLSDITHVLINDLSGRVIYDRDCKGSNHKVDIAGFAPGLYFIKINGVTVRKFVKQ